MILMGLLDPKEEDTISERLNGSKGGEALRESYGTLKFPKTL